MTKLSLSICAVLCLLCMGCSSPAPKQPTPSSTSQVEPCPLVACRLPARSAILRNDQWQGAVLDTEDALKTCAAQVLACIEQQGPARPSPLAPVGLGPSGG